MTDVKKKKRAGSKKGKVFLVGAGPGDPGLLTVKGRKILAAADVVVYDRLIHRKILAHCRRNCEKVYVGKRDGLHIRSQREINEILRRRYQEGLTVVRLKGGDPFIFGRGGEEAELLAENRIPFEIVPGVSSASAVPTYAGIPLTHRRFASSVGIVTGHRSGGDAASIQNWKHVARAFDTLVILMGVRNMENIMKSLTSAGVKKSTPAAVIEWGTTDRQRIVAGSVGNIAAKAKSEGIKPPAIIVVGRVVSLSRKLLWYRA
ncbi:MAG: uroporphyrinogen-III C-methyltransferase [bacterium]